MFFATKALVLGLFGALKCNFIKFTAPYGANGGEIEIKFGVWLYQSWSIVASVDSLHIQKSCHAYIDSATIDTAWKTSRIAIIMTGVFGFSFLLLNLIWGCSYTSHRVYIGGWEGVEYLLVAIFQGLTLLFLNSSVCKDNAFIEQIRPFLDFPEICSISAGSICVMVSVGFWVLAAAANLTARKLGRRDMEENEDIASVQVPLIGGSSRGSSIA